MGKRVTKTDTTTYSYYKKLHRATVRARQLQQERINLKNLKLAAAGKPTIEDAKPVADMMTREEFEMAKKFDSVQDIVWNESHDLDRQTSETLYKTFQEHGVNPAKQSKKVTMASLANRQFTEAQSKDINEIYKLKKAEGMTRKEASDYISNQFFGS